MMAEWPTLAVTAIAVVAALQSQQWVSNKLNRSNTSA
jgi:hypothetical protein